MTTKRRAYEYSITTDYYGHKGMERVIVFSKAYANTNQDAITQRAMVCTVVLPLYISRKEATEYLQSLRARKNGAITGLTVKYTRTTDYMD